MPNQAGDAGIGSLLCPSAALKDGMGYGRPSAVLET